MKKTVKVLFFLIFTSLIPQGLFSAQAAPLLFPTPQPAPNVRQKAPGGTNKNTPAKQSGLHNRNAVNQNSTHGNNTHLTSQQGNNNINKVDQNGKGNNQSSVKQSGDNNVLDLQQEGESNSLKVIQKGNSKARVIQKSPTGGNSVTINQGP